MMSRNVRRKVALPPQSKRRRDSDSSSSLDLSSDGGYSALDEVSDSEDDDEEGVVAAEEKHIIKDVAKVRRNRSPRPQHQDDGDDDDDDDNDDDDDEDEDEDEDEEEDDEDNEDTVTGLDGDILFESDGELEGVLADDNEDGNENADEADDSASWNGISESDVHDHATAAAAAVAAATAAEFVSSPVKRQVRFTGVPDSDSDSTTSETSDIAAEFFPDIFVEQNSLDPAFRREIEEESDSSVSSSFWDYSSGYNSHNHHHHNHHHHHTHHHSHPKTFPDDDDAIGAIDTAADTSALPGPAAAAAASASATANDPEADQELDGYETDGDTTEEDEPEPLPLRRKQARRVPSVDSDDSSDSDWDTDVPVRYRRGHPRVGRFALASRGNKPVAVMHPVTGKMVIFTPEKPREYDIMSDPFPAGMDLLPPFGDAIQSSPSMGNNSNSNTASLMMGTMFSSHTFGDYMQTSNLGPVDALFPQLSSSAFLGEDSDFDDDYEDDGEANLRLEDFIEFDLAVTDTADAVDALFDDKVLLAQSETEDNHLFSLDTNDDDNGADGDNDGDDGETPNATPGTTPKVMPSTYPGSFLTTPCLLDTDEADSVRDGQGPGSGNSNVGSNGRSVGDGANAAMPPLLAHFEKYSDAVGAFRRNQIEQQLIYSNKATPDSLAFSGPYTMGTLRGIKNGSLEAMATPITPPRRPKRRHPAGVHFGANSRSALDPAMVAQKRKASNTVPEAPLDHKRQRSISEVKDLML